MINRTSLSYIDRENVSLSPILPPNPYGGVPRYARRDPVLDQAEPLVTQQDSVYILVENIHSTIHNIDTARIFERLSAQTHSGEFQAEHISNQLIIINQRILSNSNNILNDSRYFNLRDHINTVGTSANHDLGLTLFFEMLGDSLITVLNDFINDPIIFRGLGVYIIVFVLEKLFLRIVNRPGLTIRSLITIIRGSLINSRRRLQDNSMMVFYNYYVGNIHSIFFYLERNGRFLVRRYYRNGLRARFFIDLTITSFIISGINRFRSLRFF